MSCCIVSSILYSLLSFSHKAGNVVTGEMVEELILSGADIIKVGIGPGRMILLVPPWCSFDTKAFNCFRLGQNFPQLT